jgi:hypothetical protein
VRSIELAVGALAVQPVLVLGITYREGVKELAYSRAVPLIEHLMVAGARVLAYDPLLADDEIARLGAAPWHWGEVGDARVVVTQTADPLWRELDPAWLPNLAMVYDGRNSLSALPLPPGVAYLGVGLPPEARPAPARTDAPAWADAPVRADASAPADVPARTEASARTDAPARATGSGG